MSEGVNVPANTPDGPPCLKARRTTARLVQPPNDTARGTPRRSKSKLQWDLDRFAAHETCWLPAPAPPQNAVRRAIIDNFPVRGRLPFAHVGADFRPSLHCKIELQIAARARSGKPGLAAVVGHLETKYESPPTHLDSKLGFDVAEATVSRFMPRHRKPPSQTAGWASQQSVLRTRDRIHPPECLNHVIILGERHLLRILREYVSCFTPHAPTCRWARTPPTTARSWPMTTGTSLPCQWSAACTTNTSAARPEKIAAISRAATHAHGNVCLQRPPGPFVTHLQGICLRPKHGATRPADQRFGSAVRADEVLRTDKPPDSQLGPRSSPGLGFLSLRGRNRAIRTRRRHCHEGRSRRRAALRRGCGRRSWTLA